MLAILDVSKVVDIPTLAAIFLAILLAIQGFAQRSAAKRSPGFPTVIECPNRIAELWPKFEELVRRVETASSDQVEARRLCGELRLQMQKIDGHLTNQKELDAERLSSLREATSRIEKAVAELRRIMGQ